MRADGTVVVLDATSGRVYEIDASGRPLAGWDSGLHRAMGLAAHGTTTYLGDNEQRRLLVFGSAWPAGRLGVRLERPGRRRRDRPARRAVRPQRRVRRRPRCWPAPAPTAPAGWPGAGRSSTRALERQPWHLVRAALTLSGPGAHFQLYLSTQQTQPPVDPAADDPFSDPGWHSPPVAPDATETLFAGQPLGTVWVGVQLRGEGLATPVLSQIRIDFAHQTLLRYLPAIYREDPASRQFLARWLTLFESGFDTEHELVEGLAALFDPAAADPRFLPWLAGWLALELPEKWPVPRQRQAIAGAFASYASRGTVAGLRKALRTELGVTAVVEEPIVQSGWWALPEDDPPRRPGRAVGARRSAPYWPRPSRRARWWARPRYSTARPSRRRRSTRGRCSPTWHTSSRSGCTGARRSATGRCPTRAPWWPGTRRRTPRTTSAWSSRACASACRRGSASTRSSVTRPRTAKRSMRPTSGGLVLGGEAPGRLGRDSELGHIYLTDG